MQRLTRNVLYEHAVASLIPTNGRFVFYELEGRGLVRKSNRGESRRGNTNDPREQEVNEALLELRVRGVVPWEWIVDETRQLHEWEYAATVSDYVLDSVVWARINPWPGEPPLLLVESRSLGGVLRRLAGQYLVPIAATNGQARGFLHTEIAPILRDNDREVLYLGDFDQQGHQIEANTRRILEREAGRSIAWRRIAITEQQIAERDLTPIWKKDHRYKPAQVFEAWECEALGQGTIESLVRDELEMLLPFPLTDVLEREVAQRQRIAAMLGSLGG
jgi:hypothetical protein